MGRTWTFHSAGELLFGAGASAQLGRVAARLGLKRILIVTDRPLVQAGVLDAARDPLRRAGVSLEVFDGGEPEPPVELAEACVLAAARLEPDGVLGLGGGSNMDLAKAVATVLAHGGGVRDYLGDSRVPGPVLPLICAPTTAGTGSEVTFAAVLTDTKAQVKMPILSNYLRPAAAIVDPQLMLSCPPQVTADSGIDALSHAIEAYTAIDNDSFRLPEGEASVYQGRNPLGECLAEKAIALIGFGLERVLSRPNDLAARADMALAATLGGLAFSNIGVALTHALEAAVGGAVHCSHGAGNGVLLPHVMRFNLPNCLPQMARIAELMGESISGLTPPQAAERGVEAVEKLALRAGIPARLSDLGVTEDQIPSLAEKAGQAKRIVRVNPRRPTFEDLQEILGSALNGAAVRRPP